MSDTKLYQLKPGFAKHNNLLIYFAAVPLFETQKAVYLYGHGTSEVIKMGVCCNCGRALTHPVSVELGIGPECGKHFHDWDRIGGYNKENIERLKGALTTIIIDNWVPKSQIITAIDSNEIVNVPPEHPILKRQKEIAPQPELIPVRVRTKHAEDDTSPIETPAKKEITLPAKYASQAINEHKERVIKIQFPYDLDDLERVRSLYGRKFHKDLRCWSAPITKETLNLLVNWGFTLDEKLQEHHQRVEKKVQIQKIEDIPGLRGTLRPFQREGVSFIESNNGRVLVADEMGLGKTVQALAWLQLHRDLTPAIIVTPASLKLNWLVETHAWLPNPKVEILVGETPWKPTGEILIINYDILPVWWKRLAKLKPQVLITDECHLYKNNKAQRTAAVKKLAKNVPHFIALSGTPIVNRPIEGYNAINIIRPDLFPNFMDFARLYCNAKHNGFGWDFSGASRTEELHKVLTNTIMIRRLKKDVLQELPDKVKALVPLEMDNEQEYQFAEDNFIAFIRETKGQIAAIKAQGAETLTAIEGLKQLAVKGKLKAAIAWIKDFIEVENKLVIFANHKFVIDALMDEFKDLAVKIDGSVTMQDRQRAVDIFQHNPKVPLFIGQMKSAGVGLTLTAASNVAMLEFPWDPATYNQAADRVHRIGQKDSVTIYNLLANNTIENKILDLLDQKQIIVDSVLDGKVTEDFSLFKKLIEDLVTKPIIK